MKLCYDRKSKNPTYFIQIGIRNGKKVTTKNIATIGKHNDLLAITDDPLAYAKEVVKEYNQKVKEDKVDTASYSVSFSEKVMNKGDIISRDLTANVGYFYLKEIYTQLHLSEFFVTIQR